MKVSTNVKMKKKSSPDDPKKKREVVEGSKAVLVRNKKGGIDRIEGKDYAGVSNKTLKEDRDYLSSNKINKGHFESGSAPRVGGKASSTQGGVPKGGTQKMLRISKKNVKKSAASKSAKRSALKLY